MDISSQFVACIKHINDLNKTSGNLKELNMPVTNKCKQNVFICETKKITNQIEQLQRLLFEHRPSYINFTNNFSKPISVTNSDCNKLNNLIQTTINASLINMKNLKNKVSIICDSQQNSEHRKIIILLMEKHLSYVCKMYSDLKSQQVNKMIELKEYDKIDYPIQMKFMSESNSIHKKKLFSTRSSIPELNDTSEFPNDYEQLSTEDIQMFASENEQLFSELSILTGEMNQIERKVVRINELQEIFNEKVVDQDKNLEYVLETLVGSTENVRQANEQIRKAIQRNAGFRVWILFFLLLMSFTLIFLDWYNP